MLTKITLFIILTFGIFVRMYGVDNPIGDWHSFRQADTASVARLYSEYGINIFTPKYHDVSTIQSGIFNPQGYRFVELPIYNALISMFFRVAPSIGLEVWSRFLSILFSVISAILIYILGKRFINIWGGVVATAFYMLLPFNIYFTRVILPEPLVVMLGLLGLVLFVYYFDSGHKLLLFASGLAFSLALLVKPFVVFYLVPAVYLLAVKYNLRTTLGWSNIIKRHFWFGIIVLVPLLVWRQWENLHPEGIPYFEWIFNGDGIRFRPSFWRWIFGERLGYMILGTWGLIPFAYGLLKKTNNSFIHFFLLGMLIYVSVVATANVRHDYYQTLIIPAISLALSVGAISLFKKSGLSWLILMISILVMVMVGATRIREFYKIDHPEIIDAGVVTDRLLPKEAKIIAPYNGDTAFLYQTKRIGWPYVDRPISEMISLGAEYYVSVNFDSQTREFMEKFSVVKQSDKYVILKLN